MEISYLSFHYIFPFGKIPAGTPVILYGMGVVGYQYMRQLQVTDYAPLICAVDQHWERCQMAGISVKSPKTVLEYPDAMIVIAVESRTSCGQILKLLNGFGVEDSRVVCDNHRYASLTSKVSKTFKQIHADDQLDLNKRERLSLPRMDELQEICHCLRIEKAGKIPLIRVGEKNDGGYIMLDDFDIKGIAYSFGISDDVSWDEAMVKKGFQVFMYDHTIKDLPKEMDGFHFFRKGILNSSEALDPDLLSLEEILEENGHQNMQHMILKMDVEGAEWEFLDAVKEETLEKFEQVVLELHGLLDGARTEQVTRCLRKFSATHAVVHVHANNIADVLWVGDLAYPDVLEVTFVRKKYYSLEKTTDISLPLLLDAPNEPFYDEILLGRWNER